MKRILNVIFAEKTHRYIVPYRIEYIVDFLIFLCVFIWVCQTRVFQMKPIPD